jgi:hypothetical protein
MRSRKIQTLGNSKLVRARHRPVIEEFPKACSEHWQDPPTFAEALELHIGRHGDTSRSLRRAITGPGDTFDWTTIRSWRRGQKEPRSAGSFELLARIEERYRLPTGYFRNKLLHPARATTGLQLSGISASERRRLAWHLPDDFDRRPFAEREEILAWVRRVIVAGATDYRRF